MKISKTHHRTKQGIIKRNPPKKKEFYTTINLNVWSDNTPEEVFSYMLFIIEKFPKSLLIVELDDVYVRNDNESLELYIENFNPKKVKKISIDGRKNYSFNYNVNGNFFSRRDFIRAISGSFNIVHKYGVATDDLKNLDIQERRSHPNG